MEVIWVQFLLLFSLLLLMKRKIGDRRHSKRLPPGPPKLPIIGNLHQFGALPHRSLQKLSKKHGPVMLLRLGTVPAVVVSSAETARQVLQTSDLECCSRPLLAGTRRLSYNYSDVAFSPYGDYWREMRKICVLELFSVKRVQQFRSIREEEIGLMIDSISVLSSSGNPVNLSQILMSLASEITCRVAFGSRGDGGVDFPKFQKLVHEAMGILGSFSASDFFPYVGWIIDRVTGFHGRLERVFHDLDLFIQRVMDDHLRCGSQKQEDEHIIDVLLKIKQNQSHSSGFEITQDHIKAILMDIFLAGVESAATILEWILAELAINPRVMRKAQEEIRNYIGNRGKVSESDIDQFGYLKLVIKEALRFHPPSALLTRESRSQFNINGYNIYPKNHIYINIWAIGRDPKSWKNPEKFYPERFVDSPIDFKGKHFELMTFGAGRRSCPGMNMGMAIVELALANLLYHFNWKLPNGLKEEDLNMEEVAGLSNYKKEALLLVPTKYVSCN
ncbi:hypothetical protein PTKIN_Ptkin14bG0220100 [Pterospermum kingtungense]